MDDHHGGGCDWTFETNKPDGIRLRLIDLATASVAWYNAAGRGVTKVKMGDKEGHNHFVNNPRGTVVTPEIDSRIGQSVQKECLISATDTLMYSGALQARLLRLCFPVSSRVSFEESL